MRRQLKQIANVFVMLTMVFPQQKDSVHSSTFKQSIENIFNDLYGEGWYFNWNLYNTPHRIVGQSISQNFDANDPIESEDAARYFISTHSALFNINENNLDLWVNEKHGNLRYLIFNQVYNNIPVWNGRIDFRYQLNGDLVMIGHDAFPDLIIDTEPIILKDEAKFYSKVHVDFNESLNDMVVDEPELFIWLRQSSEPVYHLAWLVELFVHSTDPNDELPVHRWKIFVDAHSGDILDKIDEVRMATVEGHVSGPVKDEPYGIATDRGMP
ncbi:uncharacterized protein METZ01_LOCUS268600, partial [marine metagenome]